MTLLTMALMGTGSFLVGLLPTYDAIGVWAPVPLVALRVTESPLIASSLLASGGGSSTPVSPLLCAGAAITALTVWRMRETSYDTLEPAAAPSPARETTSG